MLLNDRFNATSIKTCIVLTSEWCNRSWFALRDATRPAFKFQVIRRPRNEAQYLRKYNQHLTWKQAFIFHLHNLSQPIIVRNLIICRQLSKLILERNSHGIFFIASSCNSQCRSNKRPNRWFFERERFYLCKWGNDDLPWQWSLQRIVFCESWSTLLQLSKYDVRFEFEIPDDISWAQQTDRLTEYKINDGSWWCKWRSQRDSLNKSQFTTGKIFWASFKVCI